MWNLSIIKKNNTAENLNPCALIYLETFLPNSLYAFGFLWNLDSFESENIMYDGGSPLCWTPLNPIITFWGLRLAPEGIIMLRCYFLKNFIGVQLIYNVVLVSGIQQRGSVIHIHIFILFQILYPYRLLQNIEYSSLCYTVGPCALSILYIIVCVC